MSTPSATSSTGRLKNTIAGLLHLYHPKTLRERGLIWSLRLILLTYVVVLLGLWWYWSREPVIFQIREAAEEMANGDPAKLKIPGYVTTVAILRVAETLLDKPGGYLTNDVSLPGYVMDNMPSWEFGVLTELREAVRALRNDFSRAQTQSVEDKDLMLADAKFNYDHNKWILPATEWEYQEGINALRRYLDRLTDQQPADGVFYPRADNLNSYLLVVEKRLGNFAQRLSTNVRELRFTSDADSQPNSAIPAGEITASTPWMEVDNVFYEARGYAWALLHVLKAIEIDFGPILDGKNARPAVQRIIHKLKRTQQPVWSPLIMNNSGFGMLTNHSLVLASYLSRANAAIIDLRILLQQG